MRTFHYFIIEKLMSSFSSFELFLFIKEMNVNEFIQFVKSLILAFMNINNFENKLTLHTFQSLSFLSIHIL